MTRFKFTETDLLDLHSEAEMLSYTGELYQMNSGLRIDAPIARADRIDGARLSRNLKRRMDRKRPR